MTEDRECERYCNECGECMNKGYCIGDGEEYYCSAECLNEHYTPEEYDDMYIKDGAYYTEWEE